jgi:hypothetical protein
MIDAELSNGKEPFYRKVQRLFIAFCIATAPLTMAGWFALCPQSSDPACPNVTDPLAAVAAFREASPLRTQLFLTCSVIAPYICPISYLGLGMLAMRKAPWTSTLGIACGWVGSVPWGFIADSMFYFTAAAHLGQDTSFALLHSRQGLFAFPQMMTVAGGWVIGHLLGYVLLGIALFRARVIPRWASCLIVAAAPVMGPIAYGTNIGLVQPLGYMCVFAGSVPAAVVTMGSWKGVPLRVNV